MKISTAVVIAGLAMPLVVHPLRADASPMQLNATALLLVPAITGIAAGSGSTWGFGTAQSGSNVQATAAASLWRYAVQPVETSIPEPGTTLLALLALLALAAQRVRRSRAGALTTRSGQGQWLARTSVG